MVAEKSGEDSRRNPRRHRRGKTKLPVGFDLIKTKHSPPCVAEKQWKMKRTKTKISKRSCRLSQSIGEPSICRQAGCRRNWSSKPNPARVGPFSKRHIQTKTHTAYFRDVNDRFFIDTLTFRSKNIKVLYMKLT